MRFATSLLIGIMASGLAYADDPQWTVTKDAGQPVTVQYDADHVFKWFRSDMAAPLEATITLSDNTCTKNIGTKFTLVIPSVQEALIPIWIKHPMYAGAPVMKYDKDDKKPEIDSASAILSLLNGDDYTAAIQRASKFPLSARSQQAAKFAKDHPNAFGWIECRGDCSGVLPPSLSSLMIWDENFETENAQITMSRTNEAPTVNQLVSRLEEVPVEVGKNTIILGKPSWIAGFGYFLPPGVSYQILWTLDSPSLIDPADEQCQMKWDVDFTAIFRQFTAANETIIDRKKLDRTRFTPYVYDDKDAGRLSDAFDTPPPEVQK